MPAEAGIQKILIFLDSGSRWLQPAADPTFGGIASLAGMTSELINGLAAYEEIAALDNLSLGNGYYVRIFAVENVELKPHTLPRSRQYILLA
ncbi:MAG TPA: hypothetical protein VJ521_02575 [Acidobacteriota bacterium]|nr:hypothetical protein [Acidobacteriota bacterium]